MVWALLAILGVPIWLVLGGLTATVLNRRRFKKLPGVFRMKVRVDDNDKWPRQAAYARWVHDVLLINKGLALLPTTAVGIKGLVATSDAEPVKGIDDAVVFTFTLDDDSTRQVAVSKDSVSLAYGPFTQEDNGQESLDSVNE